MEDLSEYLANHEALISSTRSLFDSLLKGNGVILSNQKALHTDCEAACAAASLTQDVIRIEEATLLTANEELEVMNREYKFMLEEKKLELYKERTAYCEACTHESKILKGIESSFTAVAIAFEKLDEYHTNIVCSAASKTERISALERKLDVAVLEIESLNRELVQKVSSHAYLSSILHHIIGSMLEQTSPVLKAKIDICL